MLCLFVDATLGLFLVFLVKTSLGEKTNDNCFVWTVFPQL